MRLRLREQPVPQRHRLLVVMVTLKRIQLRITRKIPDRECTFKKQACTGDDRMFRVFPLISHSQKKKKPTKLINEINNTQAKKNVHLWTLPRIRTLQSGLVRHCPPAAMQKYTQTYQKL